MADVASFESFDPDWSVPTGATIAAILDARSLSRESFADLIHEDVETVNRLLLGLEPVSDDLANRLSGCLGSSPAFWKTREVQYQTDTERLRQRKAAASLESWVRQFPTREMAALGWIREYNSLTDAAEDCLKLFDVPDVAAWTERYAGAAAAAAFRISHSSKHNPGSVVAWLRWAELVANRIPCSHWDPIAFRQLLNTARRLTWQKDPATFLPKLRRLCAETGVAVVVAKTPRGCPASGATRFLSNDRAMMVLSFRYRTDDQFWFTFFHEAAHLLLHAPNAVFLEDGSETTSNEEDEANEFAETILVPPEYMGELLSLPLNKQSILRFARRLGVAPGIVVGQLQHKGRVEHDRLNWLKRRYAWDQIEAGRLIP